MPARILIAILLSGFCADSAGKQVNSKARTWEREVQGGANEFTDLASPHPLQYFTDDPFLRDEENDFCVNCTADRKSQVHKQHRFKTELSKIGDIQHFAVYNLFYYFDDGIQSRRIDWKSILVRVPSGQFREIYHLQARDIEIDPAYLMDAGSTEILATSDSMGGTAHNSYEAYWWFDKDGPVKINTDEAVSAALEDILPAGSEIRTGSGLNIETLTFLSGVWKAGDAQCCPTGGGVEIKFRLDKGVLTVIHKRFTPD